MTGKAGRSVARQRPRLRPRAVVYGLLLLAFGLGMLLAGLGIGVTKAGLPPETHPGLLGKQDDLENVRKRLNREPYRTWARRLGELVDATELPSASRSQMSEPVLTALRTKALAFWFAITRDRRYADRAADLIRRARSPARGGAWRSLDDLVEGAAAYALAYDLLAGYLHSSEAAGAKARILIYDMGHELSCRRTVWPRSGSDTREIRRLSALGLCALAIRDFTPPQGSSGPQQWFHGARQGVLDALQHQVCRDGAYAEGPTPHLEAARLYAPFLIANLNVTGENLLTDRALKAFEWGMRLRMPSGLRPNIDSSVLTPTCTYLLGRVPQVPPYLQWDAINSDLARAVPDDLLVEALTWFDDTDPIGAVPWGTTDILEGSGDVVFRSDWGPDAVYMLLRAERGPAREAAGGHIQMDATSFLLALGEDLLTLDSGFGGWERRAETSADRDHSLVVFATPDSSRSRPGAGQGADVTVTTVDGANGSEVSAVRVRREEASGTFDRTVLFAGKRHFVVFDQARASGGARDPMWILHVNAGGNSGGSLYVRGSRALVTHGRSRLTLALQSSCPGAATLDRTLDVHYLYEGQPQTHAVLRATASGRQSADFLAALSPYRIGEHAPRLTPISGQDWLGYVLDGKYHTAFRTGGCAPIGDYARTDGQALCWTAGDDGRLQWVLVLGATRIWVGDQLLYQAARPASFVWQPAPPNE